MLALYIVVGEGQGVLERYDIVANFDIGDALADGLNDTRALVPEHNGKGTLGVLARERVGIGVADAGVVDLDADLVSFWGRNFDVLDGEILAGFPCNCRLYAVSLELDCILPFVSSSLCAGVMLARLLRIRMPSLTHSCEERNDSCEVASCGEGNCDSNSKTIKVRTYFASNSLKRMH